MYHVFGSLRSRPLRALAATLLAPALALAAPAAWSPAQGGERTAAAPLPALHLVTLDTPGTAASRAPAAQLVATQDALLAELGDVEPVYRWTTALNGFAARLSDDQVARLQADGRVALVEPNAVRPLASTTGTGSAGGPKALGATIGAGAGLAGLDGRRLRGGAGIVVGVVDSGIWPESPLFADTPGLGRAPERFRGECAGGLDWDRHSCNRKLVGARWFVAGFGPRRLRSTESLSARDVTGHGTQVASVAAGNGGVSVSDDSADGVFSGLAPQARVAAYKACWAAPDPAEDGCATADLVTAIDRATADRVDVLNVSVASAKGFDTVGRALLGAAEADIVVTAAAGNDSRTEYAGHASPWVTTVGGLVQQAPRGELRLAGGRTFEGASRAGAATDEVPVVLAEESRAAGASRRHARQCRAGTLDAAAVQGAVVVCLRGGVGRIDKSETVRRADGVGMVLVNSAGPGVFADLHTVPTVHLGARVGGELVSHLRSRGSAAGRVVPTGPSSAPGRTARWSAVGDPDGAVVKPDLVAPAVGVLGAVPPATGRRWNTLSGTSAAAAHTAGVAALVRARHRDWDAGTVRSALATSSAPVRDGTSPLRQGAGRLREQAALAPGLVLRTPPGDHRDWLEGRLPTTALNTPSLMFSGSGTITRRVTNVGNRAMYYSSRSRGFTHHRVRVQPAALRLAPGETATFRVTVEPRTAGAPAADHGAVIWLGAQGTTVRLPVVISR